MYEYRATISRIVDGDTVHCAVDLGCDVTIYLSIRLAGINTPEVTGVEKEAGIAATAHLIELIKQHADSRGRLLLRTEKDRKEKYGRYLGTLLSLSGVNLNQQMIDDGFASPMLK